jgi:hypothetical protein
MYLRAISTSFIPNPASPGHTAGNGLFIDREGAGVNRRIGGQAAAGLFHSS